MGTGGPAMHQNTHFDSPKFDLLQKKEGKKERRWRGQGNRNQGIMERRGGDGGGERRSREGGEREDSTRYFLACTTLLMEFSQL